MRECRATYRDCDDIGRGFRMGSGSGRKDEIILASAGCSRHPPATELISGRRGAGPNAGSQHLLTGFAEPDERCGGGRRRS